MTLIAMAKPEATYMFLLKPFNNAPYYAGTASEFEGRLVKHSGSHKSLFDQARRTFMRHPFISESSDMSHRGLVPVGTITLSKAMPRRGRDWYGCQTVTLMGEVQTESKQFWESQMVILVVRMTSTPRSAVVLSNKCNLT